MASYIAGDRVSIHAGLYKKYKKGTYMRPAGTKMAWIMVDGDGKERRLWLSSIKKVVVVDDAPNATITLKRIDYEHLKAEIASLTRQLQRLNVYVNEMEG